MQVFSVVVRDSAIGQPGEGHATSRQDDCPLCHRTPDPVVNQVDYRLTSWDWEEWFLLDGAHVVSKRVQQRLAVERGIAWRPARVTAEGLELFPFFQVQHAPVVRPWPPLVHEWFCEACATTSLSLSERGQLCLGRQRLVVSLGSWGDLKVGSQPGWPWLLVRDDVAASLAALKVKNVDYIEVDFEDEEAIG